MAHFYTVLELKQMGIEFTFTPNGKIRGISLPLFSPASDWEVWHAVESEGLKATPEDIPPEVEPIEEDWSLIDAFRQSAVFARAFMGSNESIPTLNAFSSLKDAFKMEHVGDLQFAFNQLRVSLSNTTVGDFSAEELEDIKSKLIHHGFNVDGFNLTP